MIPVGFLRTGALDAETRERKHSMSSSALRFFIPASCDASEVARDADDGRPLGVEFDPGIREFCLDKDMREEIGRASCRERVF